MSDWQIEREAPDWIPRIPRKDKPQAARYVRIDGRVFLYRSKEPYISSGQSVLGAIEYNPQADTLKCHECGEWHKSLGTHSAMLHGIRANAYKKKHGLKRKTSLVSEGLRSAASTRMATANELRGGTPLQLDPEMREAANQALRATGRGGTHCPEHRNLRKTCQAQIIQRVNEFAGELRHTPSQIEIEDIGLTKDTVCFALNVATWNEAMQICNLEPNRKGVSMSRETAYALIQGFIEKYKRVPRTSDINRGLVPSYDTLKRLFGGGIKSALSAMREDGFTSPTQNHTLDSEGSKPTPRSA